VVLWLAAGLALLSPSRLVRGVARVYVEVFRGTSEVVQLFWLFFVLPVLVGLQLVPMFAGILVLGLNHGAYGAEIVRGAVRSVPRTQYEGAGVDRWPSRWEAADGLGLAVRLRLDPVAAQGIAGHRRADAAGFGARLRTGAGPGAAAAGEDSRAVPGGLALHRVHPQHAAADPGLRAVLAGAAAHRAHDVRVRHRCRRARRALRLVFRRGVPRRDRGCPERTMGGRDRAEPADLARVDGGRAAAGDPARAARAGQLH